MSSPFRQFRTAVPIGPGQGAPGQRGWKQIADRVFALEKQVEQLRLSSPSN